MGALPSPQAMRITRLASRIEPTPIVTALRGTCSSPKKSLAASVIVMWSSVIKRVRELRPEPGSLKPMCPVRPMPKSCRSRPPAAFILASYFWQNSLTFSFSTVPSGMLMFSGRMSTWSKRYSFMKRT